MKTIVPLKFVAYAMLTLFVLALIYHVLALASVVPLDMVWGGKLKNQKELINMEILSFTINIFLMMVVCIYTGIIKIKISENILKIVMWAMAAMFVINTLGNLMANNLWEKIIFTPITLLLAFFALVLALNNPIQSKDNRNI